MKQKLIQLNGETEYNIVGTLNILLPETNTLTREKISKNIGDLNNTTNKKI